MPRYSEATLAAIKHAVDIVALVGEYLTLHRSGSKFKALCPFHDDHNPSLELNPDRQSFKCWVCGAGGDVFDFVKDYERVEFPEALRMLAERAGVTLEASPATTTQLGPSKSELLAVNAWAEDQFAAALTESREAKEYVSGRGLSSQSVARFRLGYAPSERGWLLARGKRAGFPLDMLEKSGLVSRPDDAPDQSRERFRGRLMFPIHDQRGRPIAFGGRILPSVEKETAAAGVNVAKYLNSPETSVFHKRRVLYAWDLARTSAREAGWVAVVEGYTDVIAAHQVGLANVVGTLGTALGDDHVLALRRLADKVVLVFDGDDAGQAAADRALELFLGHEVDVRVLTLPEDLDPCDFLLKEGAGAFRSLVDGAVDPLAFALKRAEARFDLSSLEDSRRASEWVLAILGRVPTEGRVGIDVKVAKALDTLARRLRVPVETLERRLRQIRRQSRRDARSRSAVAVPPVVASIPGDGAALEMGTIPVRLSDLDPTDRELVQIVLNEPSSVSRVISRVAVSSLRDAALRTILQTCYDLHGEGEVPTCDRVLLRLDDRAARAVVAGLLSPIESQPFVSNTIQAPWEVRLELTLAGLAKRNYHEQLRNLKAALDETSEAEDPIAFRALQTEYRRLLTQRPDTKTKTAS